MKGNEVTRKDIIKWNKEGFFPVACRICGGVMLYPKGKYNHKDFVGWECGGALSAQCNRTNFMR